MTRVGTVTETALQAWGRGVGEAAASGRIPLPLVVLLRGPLGAGKSVLARAIARGVGVDRPMPSPTYNLRFSYRVDGAAAGAPRGPLTVHHLDLYRLADPDDVWELGWQELGQGDELVLIEWPERAEALLPIDGWDVRLGPVEGADAGGRASGAGAAGGMHDPDRLRVLRVTVRGDAAPPPAVPGGEGE